MDTANYIKDITDKIAVLNRKKDELTRREDRYDTEYCRYLLSEAVKLIPQMRDMHDLVDIAAGALDICAEGTINPSFAYGDSTCHIAMGFNIVPVDSSESPDSSGSCMVHQDKQKKKPYTIGRLFGIACPGLAYAVMVDIDWDPADYEPGEEQYEDAVYIIPRDWISGSKMLFNISHRLCYHKEYIREKKFTDTLKTIVDNFPDWCNHVKLSVDACAESLEKELDKKVAELSGREKELEGILHSRKDDSGFLAVSTENIDYII